MAHGPLKGIKVIELAHIMAGPACGLMLADMGADVIKIEQYPDGDDTRRSVPPAIEDQSAAYLMMNRNKRGCVVNLKHESGLAVVKRMLADADVVLENYRRGTMDKFGLGYDALAADNPRIVYCSISGFGRSGPYADRGGFDLIAQGMSGLMSITGEGEGRPPVKCGPPVTDITAGILATMGICAALVERQSSGLGQLVDTSLFEAGIVHTYWQSAIALATGRAPGPMGSAHPLNAPYAAFSTADGYITVGAANQSTWEKLCDAIDARELLENPRFATNEKRMRHRDALTESINERLRRQVTAHWLRIFENVGLPAGPVLDVLQMHADPQVRARDMVTRVPHQTLGEQTTLGLPVKFSRTPGRVASGAPTLGQHTRALLAEYGYTEAEIVQLFEVGAVG